MIRRLHTLLDQLEHLTAEDLKGKKWSFLNFRTQRYPNLGAVDYLKHNIRWVLDFVQSVKDKQQREFIPERKGAVCNQVWLPSKSDQTEASEALLNYIARVSQNQSDPLLIGFQ